MKRLIAPVLAIVVSLVGGMTVYGHHSPVAEPISDADAMATWVREYAEHRADMLVIYSQYARLGPGPEKSDLRLELENGLDVMLEHLESLPVRPCYASLVEFAMAELAAVVDALNAPNPVMTDVLLDHATALARASKDQVLPSVLECAADPPLAPPPPPMEGAV